MAQERPVEQPAETNLLKSPQAQVVEQAPFRSLIQKVGDGLSSLTPDERYLVAFGLTVGGTAVAFLAGACGGDDDGGVKVEPVERNTQVVKVGENGEVTPVVAGGGSQGGAATPTEDTRGGGGKGVSETATPGSTVTVKTPEATATWTMTPVRPTNTPVPPTATPVRPTATPTEVPSQDNIPAFAQSVFGDLKKLKSMSPEHEQAIENAFRDAWSQAGSDSKKMLAYLEICGFIQPFMKTEAAAIMERIRSYVRTTFTQYYNEELCR